MGKLINFGIKFGLFPQRKHILLVLCLAFVVYNSGKLFLQRHKVIFDTNHGPEKKLPVLSGCIKINSNDYRDCPESNFEKCVELRSLFNEIENRTLNVPREILAKFNAIGLEDLIKIRGSDYYYNDTFMNFNHVCFSYRCRDCNETQNLKLINTYRITYTLFIHDDRFPVHFSSHMTKQNCEIFSNCTSYHIFTERYKFDLLPAPYSSDCIDYSKEFKSMFDGYERVNSKEGCLNICLKQRYRNTFFFYTQYEGGEVRYSREFTSKDAEEHNMTEHYLECQKNCSQPNCKSSKYFMKSSNNLPELNVITFELEPTVVSLQGRPYIGVFELWLNIISFICLVLGVDILLLLTIGCSYLGRILQARLRSSHFYRLVMKSIFVTKWFLMMFLFAASLYQSRAIADDYLKNSTRTHYRIKYPSEIEKFHLHICVPLVQVIKNSPFQNNDTYKSEVSDLPIYSNESFWREKSWLDEYLRNTRLPKLVEDTFNLTQLIDPDDIYFEFGLRRDPVVLNDDWSRTFFKVHSFRGQWNKLMKCFTIWIDVNPAFYENFFVSMRLYIKFKQVTAAFFYITPVDRNLSWQDQIIYSRREVVRREIKSLVNCVAADDSKRCRSKLRCLDACVFNWVLQNYREVHLNLLYLSDYPKVANYPIHLNYSLKPNHVPDCIEKHDLNDCKMTMFDTEKTHFQYTGDPRFKILQVVFRTIQQTEVHERRLLDYILTLLNLYSILLGITCQNLMVLLYKLLELKFDLAAFKRWSRYAFKLLFSICCLVVIWFIVANTFKDELRTSLLLLSSSFPDEFPEINICFDFSHLNRNYTNLTGRELNELTEQINYRNMIEKLIVLEPTNEEKFLKWPFNNSLVKLKKSFFFLNKKCLRISYNFSWIKDHSTNFKFPLRIKLNQEMNFSYYYYASNLPNKLTMSQLNRLSYRDAYEVFLDKIQYERNDEYEELKNPWLILRSIEYKNPEKYLPQLTKEIVERINATTLWIPLHEEHFNLTIDNQRFARAYADYKRENDKFLSHNFQFDFLKERIVLLDAESNYSLKFNRETLATTSSMENEETVLSFLVNILNTFSFFFALSTFNAVDYLFQFLFKFICKIHNRFK